MSAANQLPDIPSQVVDADLGRPRPDLGLTRDEVKALAEKWPDAGLWNDVLWLSRQFWRTRNYVAWHHLVMAVGNFKRQPNRRLHPLQLSSDTERQKKVIRTPSFVVPGNSGQTLTRENPDTWWRWNFTNAGVPTRSTLLAALWPDEHHILDWRVLAVVLALTLDADIPGLNLITPDSTERVPPLEGKHYERVRELLLDIKGSYGLDLVTVERALYVLSTRVKRVKRGTERTWRSYQADLLALVPGRAGAEGDQRSPTSTSSPVA